VQAQEEHKSEDQLQLNGLEKNQEYLLTNPHNKEGITESNKKARIK